MARLVIQPPGREPLLYELVKTRVTIGRSDRNDLVLDDENVSRLHAVLERTPQGYRITDQNSRNGLFVSGQRCREALLEDGSTLLLGDTVLRFEDSSAAWNATTFAERADTAADFLGSSGRRGLREATDDFRRLTTREASPRTPAELQQKLREAERRALLFEVVSRTRQALQEASRPQEVLAIIARLVFSAMEAERSLVMLWDAEKGCLQPAAIHTAPGLELRDTGVALSQTLLDTVLRSRRAVLLRDAAADPLLLRRESVIRSGLRSAICCPMAVQDRVYGLLYADNCRRPHIFNEDDLELLSILALEAALALDGARAREELLMQERIRQLYGRFLPQHVADMLIAKPDTVRLGGERRQVTMLFADVRGFTSLAETLPPEEAVDLLNDFFTEMTALIFQHGGTLDKYIGDGLLAVFGAPLPEPAAALLAVRCAIAMQAALEELSSEWLTQGRQALRMGIGINSGEAIAGNIGSPQRMEYTVIGDAVNVAARLTQHAGPGEILVGESTYQEVCSEVASELLPSLTLKGKRQPVQVYRVSGFLPCAAGSG